MRILARSALLATLLLAGCSGQPTEKEITRVVQIHMRSVAEAEWKEAQRAFAAGHPVYEQKKRQHEDVLRRIDGIMVDVSSVIRTGSGRYRIKYAVVSDLGRSREWSLSVRADKDGGWQPGL